MSSIWLNPALANCVIADVDPDMFFVDDPDQEDYDKSLTDQAKALCFGCEIREQCLKYAVDNNLDGVWGGVSRFDRRAIHRKNHSVRNVDYKLRKKNNLPTRREQSTMKAIQFLSDHFDKISSVEAAYVVRAVTVRLENPSLSLSEVSRFLGKKDTYMSDVLRIVLKKYDKEKNK